MREGRRAGYITIGHPGDTPSWWKGMTDRLIIFVQALGQRLCAEGSWEDEWKLGKWNRLLSFPALSSTT